MHHQLQVTMYIILPAALSHALRRIVEFVECYFILQDLHQQIIVMSQKMQGSSRHVLAVIVQHVDGASFIRSWLARCHIMHITSALFASLEQTSASALMEMGLAVRCQSGINFLHSACF